VGDKELEYVHAPSPTELVGYLSASNPKHLEKIRVTFQSQEAISTQNFSLPWISFDNFTGPDSPPGAAAINGNNAYVGFGDSNFNEFWRYESANYKWTKLTDFPGAHRLGIVGFTAGGKGYFGGGYANIWYKDLWEYNYANGIWTQRNNLPTTKDLATGFDYLGYGYVVERDGNSSNLWKYDHNIDSWTMISIGPFESYDNASRFILQGNLYLEGAQGFWQYNFVADEWTDLGAAPDHIYFTITVGGTAYGLSQNFLYKYDSDTNIWALVTSPVQYLGTPNSAFSAGGKAIVYLGGAPYEFDPSY
jgi:N-acetylneuraminic acid mutarotase